MRLKKGEIRARMGQPPSCKQKGQLKMGELPPLDPNLPIRSHA